MAILEYDTVVVLDRRPRRQWLAVLASSIRRRHAERIAMQALARMDPHLLADAGFENDSLLGEIRRVVPENERR
ncbi:hypothetical protein XM25_05545 [Devosia sp. H5989]|nr:hypothetical protein XM25_05545 [Devosia sp. H5989]